MLDIQYICISNTNNETICHAPTEDECERIAHDLGYSDFTIYPIEEKEDISFNETLFELTKD